MNFDTDSAGNPTWSIDSFGVYWTPVVNGKIKSNRLKAHTLMALISLGIYSNKKNGNK
jgi:hypothetical protein